MARRRSRSRPRSRRQIAFYVISLLVVLAMALTYILLAVQP